MPRPFEKWVTMPIRIETATGYAFPSGHTQSATSFWGGSMVILRSRSTIVIGTLIILLTAFSRLYLGLHWPLDTVGGILFGLLSVFLADHFLGEKGILNRWHVIAASAVLLLALLLPVEEGLVKTTAVLWGMTWGGYMEQKYIQFHPLQKRKIQLIKIIIGVLGILVIYGGLKVLFPSHKVFDMIRYALLALWIAAGAPYVFKKLKFTGTSK